MKRIVSVLILFLSSLSSVAQITNVTGRVQEANGSPLEFVNVVLLSLPDSTFIQGVITDENGAFSIPNNDKRQKLLKISYLGYETFYAHCTEGNVGIVTLQASSILLAEAVVTADLKINKMRNGNIVTDIANSSLKKEYKAMDILKKIPGMTVSQGKLEVFGLGEPIVYINNKKVNNKEEINMLDPKNIKEIELITNPGAKYDASGKAVLKIVTLNREDGWNTKVDLTATRSRKFSNGEGLAINYKKKGLSLSGLYNFEDHRGKSKQDFINTVEDKDVLWKYNDKLRSDNTDKQHNYQIGADYSITENHSIGIQYNGTNDKLKSNANDIQSVYKQESPFSEITSKSLYDIKSNRNHVNMFYIGKLSRKLSMEVDADYVKSKNDQQQAVSEKSNEGNDNVDITTKTNSKLKAAKAEFYYKTDKIGTITAGGEFSRIDVDGWLKNPDNSVKSTDFTNKEDKQAYYLMYNINLGRYNVNAGCRYEVIKSEMNDLLNPDNDIRRNYHDWFPSASVSATFGQLNSSLSYSVRTTRPAFSRLNSNVYYNNKHMIQIGNPQLQPSMSHNIQLLLNYKTLVFKLGYSYMKDYINSVFSSEGNVIIVSWKNFNNSQQFRGNISYTKTIGIWNTTLAGGITLPRLKIEYQGNQYNNNKAKYYVQCNNYFNLPKEFTLSLDYTYDNGGSIGIYKFKPYHSLNFGIQKSCFSDKLNIGLTINDIFRTMVYKYDSRMGNIYFHQKEDQDERFASINIVYRLNNMKSKYRGSGAANSDIKRLQ